jgi:hypothetical protein
MKLASFEALATALEAAGVRYLQDRADIEQLRASKNNDAKR